MLRNTVQYPRIFLYYNCSMVDTRPLFTIAAFAIIFDTDGQVLLCHRRDMDAWNLPGGGLEPGELPNECVVREIHEETGLVAEVEKLVGVYGKPGRNEVIFSFICKITGGELSLTNESDNNRYFPPDNLPPNTLYKHAERIWDAAAHRNGGEQPLFRKQYSLRSERGARPAE